MFGVEKCINFDADENSGEGRYDVTMMSMEFQGLYGGWWRRV